MDRAKASGSVEAAASENRLLLKNGLIVDGTGKKGFTGNLLIHGDRIEKVTPSPIDFAGETLDCTGKVVSPGFIDIHSHMDGPLAFAGHEEIKIPFTAQGCTTFVAGNCGMSAGSVRKGNPFVDKVLYEDLAVAATWDGMDGYFRHLETIGLTHNLVNLAGNGTTRMGLRGFKADPLSPDEMRETLRFLEEALDQGAAGVSFGLQYAPDLFCTPDEVLAVACLVQKKDKIMTVHGRAYSVLSGIYPRDPRRTSHSVLSLREMIDVARRTGVRLQYSHLMFAGSKSHASCRPCLDELDRARAEDIDVMTDTYPYHCGISVINVILPLKFQANLKDGFKDEKMVADVERALVRMEQAVGLGFKDIQFAFADDPEFKPYQGKFISEIAEAMGISPARVVLKLSEATKGRARILNHNYSDMTVIDALMAHPQCLFMTDSTPAVSGFQNPASFGAFPLLLQYARDRRLIPLEEAVRKMTGASAERLKIKDRGFLKEGLAADITVFDWNGVRDNNTVTKTDCTPAGIEAVFINGRQVMAQGKVDGSVKAGRVLRI